MKIEHRIEWNYAGAQSSFWIGHCALTGYTAVLLGVRGFSDVQVGLTSSLMSVLTIVFQLLISNFSDHHPRIAIKKIITVLYLLAMATGGVLLAGGVPVALMMISFALNGAFKNTIVGLFNALVMQYVNADIPVRIGWPRGVGSVVYAVCAYVLGRALEIYSPDILIPTFLCTTIISITLVLLMPDVNHLTIQHTGLPTGSECSAHFYRQMPLATPVPTLSAGRRGALHGQHGFLFLIRVVKSRGGGATELGISMFLQAVVEMPIMFMTPWILKRFKPANVLVVSFFAYALKTFLMLISRSMGMVYIAMSLNMFSFGLYCISSVYFVNSLVRPGERVRAQGLISLCGSAGGIIGSAFAGAVLDSYGIQVLLLINTLISLLGAFIMIVCNKSSRGYVPAPLPN